MSEDADAKSGSNAGGTPDPDHAWKALSLVNDWIRHGDAKIGVSLALTGGAGVLLFNLTKDISDPSCAFKALGVACAVALVVAAFCAVIGLIPQVKIGKKREPEAYTNLLFYKHVARGWASNPKEYVRALGALTMDKQDLTKHISEQVYANAHVARRKFQWADHAIRGLAIGVLLLAATALTKVVS